MTVEQQVAALLPARQGHFVFESGHHSESWIDLERLFLRPQAIRPLATALAGRIARHAPDVVCGPLVEGAYVALMVAEHLDLPFTYAERIDEGARDTLFPVRYRLPASLDDAVRGRRVAIVNDVVSAGSSVKGTHADLVERGAVPVAIAALAAVGETAAAFAAAHGLGFDTLVTLPPAFWAPRECPLCAAGLPLTPFDHGAAPIESSTL